MKRLIYAILAITIIAGLTACGGGGADGGTTGGNGNNNGNQQPTQATGPFPYAVGSTWTYTISGSATTAIALTVTATGATPQVNTSTTTGGTTTTRVNNYAIDGDRLYSVGTDGTRALTQPDQWVVGYIVRYNVPPFDYTYAVVALDTVTVPAGTFAAYRYTIVNAGNPAAVDVYWYTLGIGTVKYQLADGTSGVLESYSIK